MSDATPLRINLQDEEVKYRASVSEATLSRVASSVNFINYYQYKHFEFGYLKALSNSGSPTYNQYTPPATISDVEPFPSNSQIVAIVLQHNVSGSGGTSELDIQWSTENSGTWASIFSTTPKATSSAPSDSQFDTTYDDATSSWVSIATTPAGCTIPVLSKTMFNAGDRLRCRAVSHQAGTPNGFTMRIFYRPA
jgi:hypothetical protein